MRWLWRTLKALAVLALVAVVAAAVWLSQLDLNAYRGRIEAAAEEATGRALSIEGDASLAWGRPIAIAVEDVALANAAWGGRPEMARLARIEADVRLWPLLEGRIELADLTISGLDLLLETDAGGRGNWTFKSARAAEPDADPGDGSDQGAGAAQRLPAIDAVRIEDSTLAFRDGASGETTAVRIEHLTMRPAGPGEPIAFDAAAAVADLPVRVSGTVGPLDLLQARGAPYPVALTLRQPGGTASLEGTLSRPLQGRGLDLALSLALSSPAATARALGLDVPDLPEIAATGRLRDREGAYVLDDLRLRVGRDEITGTLAYAPAGPRPRVRATLNAETFDLAQYLSAAENPRRGQPGEDGGAGADGRLIPDAPLPWDALTVTDGEVSLFVGKVVLPRDGEASGVRLDAALDGGRLSAAHGIARIASGRLAAELNADAHRRSLGLDLELEGAATDAVLGLLGVAEVIEGGTLEADVAVSGTGQRLREVLATASGHLRLVDEGGEIGNAHLTPLLRSDLLRQFSGAMDPLLGPLVGGDAATRIGCAVVRARIDGGVAHFDRGLALETDRLTLAGGGRVDLGRETLDLSLHVDPERAVGLHSLGGGVADLASARIAIGGTLAEPRVGVDSLDLAQRAARAGAGLLGADGTPDGRSSGGLLDEVRRAMGGGPAAGADAPPRPGPSACRTALGLSPAAPPPASAPPGAGPNGTQGGGAAGRQEPDAETLDRVRDQLKGLFGR
jgi:uncharacterized protein involved in outer membrane biogenesis